MNTIKVKRYLMIASNAWYLGSTGALCSVCSRVLSLLFSSSLKFKIHISIQMCRQRAQRAMRQCHEEMRYIPAHLCRSFDGFIHFFFFFSPMKWTDRKARESYYITLYLHISGLWIFYLINWKVLQEVVVVVVVVVVVD